MTNRRSNIQARDGRGTVETSTNGSAASGFHRGYSGQGNRVTTPTGLVVFVSINIGLAFIAQKSPIFSTTWALAALLAGLVAASQRFSWGKVTVALAYIAGAEMIWRGTHALVFWEFGKYCFILIILVSVLANRLGGRFDIRGLAIVICVVPSILVLPYIDRSEIAFNLSGPVCLGLGVLFFAGLPVSRRILANAAAVALGPTMGLAALSTAGTLAADPADFYVGGKLTTAGIGPNQVSSTLGFGLFLVFVLFMIGPRRASYRLVLFISGIWLGVQILLSFSRGGLYTFVGAVIVAAFPLMRSSRSRWVLVVGSILAIAVFRYVLIPATDQVSRGMVSDRIADSDLTGRDRIMKADLITFLEYPIFGVGPGQSFYLHALTFRRSAAHTEYTRLLAEHGTFGIIVILLLASIGWDRWRLRGDPLVKSLSLGFTAWALLYFGHAAIRQVVPAFCFGIGGARLFVDEWRAVGAPRVFRSRGVGWK